MGCGWMEILDILCDVGFECRRGDGLWVSLFL